MTFTLLLKFRFFSLRETCFRFLLEILLHLAKYLVKKEPTDLWNIYFL